MWKHLVICAISLPVSNLFSLPILLPLIPCISLPSYHTWVASFLTVSISSPLILHTLLYIFHFRLLLPLVPCNCPLTRSAYRSNAFLASFVHLFLCVYGLRLSFPSTNPYISCPSKKINFLWYSFIPYISLIHLNWAYSSRNSLWIQNKTVSMHASSTCSLH